MQTHHIVRQGSMQSPWVQSSLLVSAAVALASCTAREPIPEFARARARTEVEPRVTVTEPQGALASARLLEIDHWRTVFEAQDATGCFLLWTEDSDRIYGHNLTRAQTSLSPASTFKIFNALVSLDVGAVEDENTLLTWDGVDRGWDAWNEDQSLSTAFRRSTVWVYQELARRVGELHMTRALRDARYGNQILGGPIDQFWLRGGLAITPLEQMDFLHRLYRGDLPFSERSMERVRRIMVAEVGADYVVCAKTGWSVGNGPEHGWVVGWVVRADGVHYFALNVAPNGPAFDMRRAREEISAALLAEMGILPWRTFERPGDAATEPLSDDSAQPH